MAINTKMYTEAQSAPEATERFLANAGATLSEITSALKKLAPPFVVTCARGSSDHAATFLKYLVETRLGIPVVSLPPSIASLYNAPIKLAGAAFVTISQSGGSPDLITAARKAQAQGALVIGLINAEGSNLEKVCDHVLPLHAGAEQSVAATKSYILSLIAASSLVAHWAGDDAFQENLNQLPSLMKKAWKNDWSEGTNALKNVQSLFTVSRGLGLGIAQEAALKFKETSSIHAEAFSGAEVKHGPMAIVKNGFTVLLFASPDLPADHNTQMVQDFHDRGAVVLSAGQHYDNAVHLPIPETDCPVNSYILMILCFYRMVNNVSLDRGLNPDEPPFLKKVTETV